MRPRTPLVRATALAGAALLLLGACTREAPVAPEMRPSLDVDASALVADGEEAMPDSGEMVFYPTDVVAENVMAGGPVARAALGDGDESPRLMAAAADAASEPTVRIGVVQAASSIVLGSDADFVLKDRAGGATLLSGRAGTVSVTLVSKLVSNYRLQVVCGGVAAVNEWKARAEAAGHPTFTNFNPTANCTRLFIGEFLPNASFGVRNPYRNQLLAAGLAKNDSFWVVVSFGATLYEAKYGTTTESNVDPVVLTSSDGIVTINGGRYRGAGEAGVNGAGTMAGVNVLPIEQYLYGVVPRELGPVAFPEMEAQRAQAVAARTYAISGLGKRVADGYDLRATTDDQVYGGYAAEHPASTEAVNDTRGVVATYQGKLIQALFSSTSGGHTADNEEVFNSAPVPYLRGVVDSDKKYPPGLTVTKEAIRGSSDLRILRQTRTQDFETEWASRFHRWTFDWTREEIASILSTSLGKTVTTVYEINELSRGPSGRVLALEYVTDVGRDTVRKDAIRSSLKFINASGPQSLLSTLFFIEATDEKGHQVRRQSYGATEVPAPAGFRVYGAGWGHGVGMAQTGAVGMAQAGYSYEAILKRYYTGVELETRY